MARSFLAKCSPSRARTKDIDWPFAVDVAEGEQPRVRMHVLGADKLEAALLAAVDHFDKLRADKSDVKQTDAAFAMRERTGMVFYAFSTLDNEPIADSIDELAAEPTEVINALYDEWSSFQSDVTTRPMTGEQMTEFVEELKKNTLAVPLIALPSSWLIALCRTLAGQLASSTPASGAG